MKNWDNRNTYLIFVEKYFLNSRLKNPLPKNSVAYMTITLNALTYMMLPEKNHFFTIDTIHPTQNMTVKKMSKENKNSLDGVADTFIEWLLTISTLL